MPYDPIELFKVLVITYSLLSRVLFSILIECIESFCSCYFKLCLSLVCPVGIRARTRVICKIVTVSKKDLIHLLVPRVFEAEQRREADFNSSLRRISLEGSAWHTRKELLWKNQNISQNPKIRINLINDQTHADKVLIDF